MKALVGGAPAVRASIRVLAFACLGALALTVSGCWWSKDKPRQPATLIDIKKPSIAINDVWSRGIGDGDGGSLSNLRMAVSDDAIYVAAADGRVEAWDPKTGRRPSISGDNLLIGTMNAKVLALRRGDGSVRWTGKASAEVMAPPTGAGDVAVVNATDGHVFGLSEGDGSRLWNFDRSVPELTLRGLSAPLYFDGRIFIGLDDGHLQALNPADGVLVWEQTISVPSGRTILDRLTDIDADLLPSSLGVFVVTYGGDIALLDTSNGQAIWRRSVKSYSGMTLGDGKLFVTDADGGVLAFDSENGAQLWHSEDLKFRRLSPPAYFNGSVVVGDYKGYLHWLSAADGSMQARTRLGHKPIVAPLVTNGSLLYAMDRGGDVVAYDSKPR